MNLSREVRQKSADNRIRTVHVRFGLTSECSHMEIWPTQLWLTVLADFSEVFTRTKSPQPPECTTSCIWGLAPTEFGDNVIHVRCAYISLYLRLRLRFSATDHSLWPKFGPASCTFARAAACDPLTFGKGFATFVNVEQKRNVALKLGALFALKTLDLALGKRIVDSNLQLHVLYFAVRGPWRTAWRGPIDERKWKGFFCVLPYAGIDNGKNRFLLEMIQVLQLLRVRTGCTQAKYVSWNTCTARIVRRNQPTSTIKWYAQRHGTEMFKRSNGAQGVLKYRVLNMTYIFVILGASRISDEIPNFLPRAGLSPDGAYSCYQSGSQRMKRGKSRSFGVPFLGVLKGAKQSVFSSLYFAFRLVLNLHSSMLPGQKPGGDRPGRHLSSASVHDGLLRRRSSSPAGVLVWNFLNIFVDRFT